jgi:hypothetical protein
MPWDHDEAVCVVVAVMEEEAGAGAMRGSGPGMGAGGGNAPNNKLSPNPCHTPSLLKTFFR